MNLYYNEWRKKKKQRRIKHNTPKYENTKTWYLLTGSVWILSTYQSCTHSMSINTRPVRKHEMQYSTNIWYIQCSPSLDVTTACSCAAIHFIGTRALIFFFYTKYWSILFIFGHIFLLLYIWFLFCEQKTGLKWKCYEYRDMHLQHLKMFENI